MVKQLLATFVSRRMVTQLLLTSTLTALAAASGRRRSDVRELDAHLLTSEPRDLPRFLHDTIRMTDDEIAAIAGVKDQTVRRWRSTGSPSSPRSGERLDDLRAIVILLLQSGVLYPEEVGRWLRARNADLDYARPNVFIRQGKFEAVRNAAECHVRRLEGRTVTTLEAEIEEFLTAEPADRAVDQHERVGRAAIRETPTETD